MKDIIDYKWTKDEELEITFQPSNRFALKKEVTKVWTIRAEDKEKIDEIFNRYIDIER
ncbi:hypothetical protein KQI88_05390 [Alkaliphilus sp. MSJ-5]|uniref:Uncharacterized protein n=1 Tax=Alkaliphilus flagellatus TaxID=2841507 RepID=A0ABS6G0X4_9FIRM|nr:hypothetical protein [Alkaliphilus flagellatus]MBU5675844.1 hypothetical protein [Alkaliphilus flagellatus]